jgi:sulfate transport system ATP-binding protein
MTITIQNITKRFGAFVALDNVSLRVPADSILALLGPSGSGKTTLLRVIAGLEIPDSGTILYDDEDVTGSSPRERNIGFVFQHYALFRHMSVFENVAFGLRVRNRPEAEVRERVTELLSLIRLEGLERRLPAELSGGQRQRVALARSLAARPKLLLLDEPFGALDARVRQELRQWLRRLHDEIGMTSVFVTHDQEEAFEVADRVVVMNHGRIEQVGTPREVFDQPANAFVMDFLGNVNVFHGRLRNGRAHLGAVTFEYPGYPHEEERSAILYVRPHELDLDPEPQGPHSLPAQVMHANPAGAVARLQLRALESGAEVHAELPRERFDELNLTAGDTVYISPRRVRAFVPEPEPDYSI